MPNRPDASAAPRAEPTDEALWAQCRRGSQGAWHVLVRRYQRLVYTVPRRAGLSDEAAADVFQFTFSKLFEQLERLEDPSRLRAWLVTTSKRETLRLLEESRRRVDLSPAAGADGEGGSADDATDPLELLPSEDPLPPEQLEALQLQHRLRAAVERLDERSRRFVELVFLSDDPPPYSEVAARLGMAEGSIGPTRARCLAKLRALLDEGG